MSNERLRRIKSVGLLGLSICSLGVLVDCPGNSPPRLMCGDFSMFVQPGTCELFTNPCDEDHQWLSPEASLPDGFELFGRPASVYVRRDVSGGVTTRSICAASGSGNIANQSVAFKYGRDTFDRGYLYGTGHMTLTVANVLHAALSATPARINAGESSQLVAIVSGGIPPYSYFWTPTSGLSATYIPILLASPTVTTTYQLMVVDSAGQPLGARPGENPSTSVPAEVTVFVNFEVQAFANPRVIRGGDVFSTERCRQGRTPSVHLCVDPDLGA